MVAGVFLAACGESTKTAEENQEVATAGNESVSYTIDPATSTVVWTGAKLTETVHTGDVKISEGNLSFEGENLTAGNFTIDMTSITQQDRDPSETGPSKLVGHLKSGDFFLVDSFPNALFEITSTEKIEGSSEGTHTINGNLTIKGQTHGISFPAIIAFTETGATANATFEINRNDWGIIWGGSKETNRTIIDKLKNNLVKDMIAFKVALVANK